MGDQRNTPNLLIDRGLVRRGTFTAASGKRHCSYLMTPKGLSEKAVIAGSFLVRNMHEHAALKGVIGTLQREIQSDTDRVAST